MDLSSWNSVWAIIKLRPELLALLALPCGAGFRIHQHYFCLIFSSVFSFDKLTMFGLNLSWSVSHRQAATSVFWTLLLICFVDIFYQSILLFCFLHIFHYSVSQAGTWVDMCMLTTTLNSSTMDSSLRWHHFLLISWWMFHSLGSLLNCPNKYQKLIKTILS